MTPSARKAPARISRSRPSTRAPGRAAAGRAPRVLLTDPRPDRVAREADARVDERIVWVSPEEPDLRDVEVWLCASSPPGVHLHLPSLRWIHSGWAGVEAWFRRPEWRPGVRLTRTVGEFPERMAEYVFAYLLAQELGVARALHQMQKGTWRRWIPGTIAGRSLLVVGYGAIGRRIGEVGRALALRVEGVRRGPVPDEERRAGIHPVDELVACLPRADVVVNLLPYTRETDSFWNRRRFERMRSGSVFINISRGATIDEGALLDGIRRGRPGRAILDVFREEPLPPDHPLRGLDEIWVTPHIAGIGTPAPIAAAFAANWKRFRAAEPLQDEVDRARGY